MTLEEGIIHAEDVAKMNHEAAKHLTDEHPTQAEKCEACAEDHIQLAEWLKDYKRLLEQEPKLRQALEQEKGAYNALAKNIQCADCISRQAVLDAMYELCDTGETLKENPWRDNPHIDAITDAIENLPSVTPQQRTGRWIKDEHGWQYKWVCSNCETHHRALYDYCPSCGAKMEVEE